MASQLEKDAYRATKGNGSVNISTAPIESETYTRALVVEEVTPANIALTVRDGVSEKTANAVSARCGNLLGSDALPT